MDLSSLNVDVLLYLLKFVNPVDCYNLALSGILKGFENVSENTDLNEECLNERITDYGIKLGLRRGGTCELEIRSLEFIGHKPNGNHFNILKRLVEEGFLQNNQELKIGELKYDLVHYLSIVRLICSMENLEKLDLHCDMTLEDLADVFQSCSKLTELYINTDEFELDEMDENLKNRLRPGFQRLRCFHLVCYTDNDSWPVLQEMLTWLKECVKLAIYSYTEEEDMASLVIDGSLILDPNLAKNLEILILPEFPAAIIKWIISVCLNIHTMRAGILKQPNGLHNEIARLKKLKNLDGSVYKASELAEIVRSCRQLEKLEIYINRLTLRDLAECKPAENITDITIYWGKGPTSKEILPVFKRWTHLRRLEIMRFSEKSALPFEVLSDFIMAMKNLSHLHIDIDYGDAGQRKILRDKVNELILPRRPNFKFN